MNSGNTDVKKKRGNPGNFHGQRLEFLLGHETRLEATGSTVLSNAFFGVVYSEYWMKFPWRLPRDEEPPSDPLPVLSDDTLSVDEIQQKGSIIAMTHKVNRLLQSQIDTY
jgi:hypothetical protein